MTRNWKKTAATKYLLLSMVTLVVATPVRAQSSNCGLPCVIARGVTPATTGVQPMTPAQIQAERLKLEQLRAQNELLRAQAAQVQAETARQRRELDQQNREASERLKPQDVSAGVEVQRQQVAIEAFKLRVVLARAKYADFDAVVSRQDVILTPVMQQALIESEVAGDLIYYLGQHPEESRRIAALSPVSSILEIGKISARFP